MARLGANRAALMERFKAARDAWRARANGGGGQPSTMGQAVNPYLRPPTPTSSTTGVNDRFVQQASSVIGSGQYTSNDLLRKGQQYASSGGAQRTPQYKRG